VSERLKKFDENGALSVVNFVEATERDWLSRPGRQRSKKGRSVKFQEGDES